MIPDKIGRYEIREELGRGGMATVYRGFDPSFKREVAIKVLPREMLHDPTFRARFEREAQAICALDHPAIIPVYDYGEDGGQLYLVMRLMLGGSLGDRLKHGPMSVEQSVVIMQRVGAALDEAHRKGIVHRDLKPGNILFDQRGEAAIGDFGIAKVTEGGPSTLSRSLIIGTPAYMSPEQANGETDIDGRSDLYALGVILYEMLTGQMPYQADTPIALAIKHVVEPVPRILDANPNLPPGLQAVIDKAMAKQREDRFATGVEMAAALSSAARGEPIVPPRAEMATVHRPIEQKAALPESPTPKAQPAPSAPGRRVPWAVIAVVAIVILAIGGFAVSQLAAPAATATPEPTATATAPPTPIPPTSTPGPTRTPVPTPEALTTVATRSASIFAGPSASAQELAVVDPGDSVTILGRAASGEWLYVANGEGVTGFVFGPFFDLAGNYEDLPVQAAAAAPAATSGPQATAPAGGGPPTINFYPIEENGYCQPVPGYNLFIRGEGGVPPYDYLIDGRVVASDQSAEFVFDFRWPGDAPNLGVEGEVIASDGQSSGESDLFLRKPEC